MTSTNSYNDNLKNKLDSKLPLMLLPTRIETRFARTGSIYSPFEELVNDALTSVDFQGNQQLSPQVPSTTFDATLGIIQQIEQVGAQAAQQPAEAFNGPAFYKLSILESRLSNFAEASINSLNESVNQQKNNRQEIARLADQINSAEKTSESENKGLPGSVKSILESKTKELLRLCKNVETIDSFKASDFSRRQEKIIREIRAWNQYQKNLPPLNEADLKLLNQSNRTIKNAVSSWNQASVAAINKYESFPEFIKKKLSKTRAQFKAINEKIIAPTEFAEIRDFWKTIDTLHLQTQDLTQIKPSKRQEQLTHLSQQLYSTPLETLPLLLKENLGAVFASFEYTANEEADNDQQKQPQDLVTLLKKRIAQLEKLKELEDCENKPSLSSRIKNSIFDLCDEIKILAFSNLETISKAKFVDWLNSLLDKMEQLNHLLSRLGKVSCEDCEALDLLLTPLCQTLKELPPAFEPIIERFKNEEKSIQTIRKKIKEELSNIVKNTSIPETAFTKNIHDIKWLLNDIFSCKISCDNENRIVKINKIFNLLVQSTKLLNGIKELSEPFKTDLLSIIAVTQAITLFPTSLKDDLQELNKKIVSIQALEKLFAGLLKKKVSQCKSGLYDEQKKLFAFFVNDIEQKIAVLKKESKCQMDFIRQSNEKIYNLGLNILLIIDSRRRVNQEDQDQLKPLIKRLITKLKSWREQIKLTKDKISLQQENLQKANSTVNKASKNFKKAVISSKLINQFFKIRTAHYLLKQLNNSPCFIASKNRSWWKINLSAIKQLKQGLESAETLPAKSKQQITKSLVDIKHQQEFPEIRNYDYFDKVIKKIERDINTSLRYIEEKGKLTISSSDNILANYSNGLASCQSLIKKLILEVADFTSVTQSLRLFNQKISQIKLALEGQPSFSREQALFLIYSLKNILIDFTLWQKNFQKKWETEEKRIKQLVEVSQEFQSLLFDTLKIITLVPVDPPVSEELNPEEKIRANPVRGLVSMYQIIPGNHQLWIRVYPDDIAIDSHDPELTQEEIDAAKAYWNAIWHLPNTKDSRLGHWRVIADAFGYERAAYLIKYMKPQQSGSSLVFPSPTPKEYSWNKASDSKVMPDQYVFALYEKGLAGAPPNLVFGNNTIPETLITGIDPKKEDSLVTTSSGDLIIGPDLLWTVNFHEALLKGMAVRVDLPGPDVEFDKILVFGVKTKNSSALNLEARSKQLIEQLFDGHHYSPGGMSFVPPGTPTNNTSDTNAGYSPFPDDEDTFDHEILKATDLDTESDGQILADALGIDPILFKHVEKADSFSNRNAGIMNHTLWQATLGYYMEEMYSFYKSGDHLFNTVEQDDIEAGTTNNMLSNLDELRAYMEKYVRGRGALPSIRVGDQPYGFLPIGVLHNSEYQYHPNPYDVDPHNTNDYYSISLLTSTPFFDSFNIEQPIPGSYGNIFDWNSSQEISSDFTRDILNVLLAMKSKWNEIAAKKVTVDDPIEDLSGGMSPEDKLEQAQLRFMNILGLHAQSVSFYSRYGVGSDAEALKEELFGNAVINFKDYLGYSQQNPDYYTLDVPFIDLFFRNDRGNNSLYPNYQSSLEWIWGSIINSGTVSEELDFNSSFLSIAQLRFLDQPTLLTGEIVDKAKSSDSRPLSQINGSSQNYIQWLKNSSCRRLLEANVEGKMPSRSLLFLLLLQSIVNYYWDAAMRIYENMLPNSDPLVPKKKLLDVTFRSFPDIIIPTWNFVNKTWADTQVFFDTLSTNEEKELMVKILNFVIDFEKLIIEETNHDNYIGQDYSRVLFGIYNNQLTFNYDADSSSSVFLDPLALNSFVKLSDYCLGRPIDRRSYKTFGFDWDEKFVEGVKSSVYEWVSDNYLSNIGNGTNDPKEIANKIAEDDPDNQYFIEADIDFVNNFEPIASAEPIKYVFKYANSRIPFLLHFLKPGDVLNLPLNPQSATVDNTMAGFLSRGQTYNDYPDEMAQLGKVRQNLDILSQLSTGELERLMAEHLDLCSHRLDAWLLSPFNRALKVVRSSNSDGSYIGAFGCVMNLKKGQTRTLASDETTTIVVDAIDDRARGLVAYDPDNQGFIHAPSINHAITAAALRAGYMATGGGANTSLEIGLDSTRVKKGLWYLQGIRNHQSLGALLGYQLERRLHETLLSEYVYNLRELFPLVSDTLLANQGNSIETVQANNVIDGLKLLEDRRGETTDDLFQDYISGLSSSVKLGINAIVDEIEDHLDAVSDLIMSETMFQVSKGNYDKASAFQKAVNEGNYIPEPEIVKTPRSGQPFTQRVALVLEANIDQSIPTNWGNRLTPRAQTEPTLNKWLGEQLGDPATIGVKLYYSTMDDPDTEKSMDITFAPSAQTSEEHLNLQPIDLILLAKSTYPEQQSALARYLMAKGVLKAATNSEIPIEDSMRIDFDQVGRTTIRSYCEVFPLIQSLAKLVKSTIMQPDHLIHPSGIQDGNNNNGFINISDLTAKINQVESDIGNNGLLQNLTNKKMDFDNDVSGSRAELIALIHEAYWYNIPEALFTQSTTLLNKEQLLDKTEVIIKIISKRMIAYNEYELPLSSATDKKLADAYLALGKILFGKEVVILPIFKLLNPSEQKAVVQDSGIILPSKPLVLETWITRAGRVREKVKCLEDFILYSDLYSGFDGKDIELKALQFPHRPNDHWIGDEIPSTYFKDHDTDSVQISRDKVSFVSLFGDNVENTILGSSNLETEEFAGLIVDEWNEVIPNDEETSGIAYHYDQPNSEAPQTILLALPPKNGDYTINYILDTINTALDLAKIRAVEPEELTQELWFDFQQGYSQSNYLRFFFSHSLPGILSKVVDFSKNLGISNDYNTNNLNNDPDSLLFDFGDLPLAPFVQQQQTGSEQSGGGQT